MKIDKSGFQNKLYRPLEKFLRKNRLHQIILLNLNYIVSLANKIGKIFQKIELGEKIFYKSIFFLNRHFK